MRSWPVVVVAMLVGCNDHGAGKLTELKDEVCACKTADCAEKIMARVPQTKIDSNSRTQKLAREMLDCVAKLQAVDRPETDPDAERSAEPPATGSAPAAGSAPAPAPATGSAPAPTPATGSAPAPAPATGSAPAPGSAAAGSAR